MCVYVCKRVDIQSLRLRNDVAGPLSAGLEPSPHSTVGDSGPERLERRAGGRSRFTSVPFLPKSG